MTPEPSKLTYLTPAAIRAFKNPPVGTIVHWYPQADADSQKTVISAAMVTSQEGPGVVSLTVFPKAANPRYLFGVRYISDPFHQKKSEATMKNGGWREILETWTPESVRSLDKPYGVPVPDDTRDASPDSIQPDEPPKPRRGRPPKLKPEESNI